MARVLVFALLLVAVAVVALMVLAALRIAKPTPVPQRPASHGSNAQWSRYYRDMAAHARGTGDEGSAVEYDSLSRMYADLPPT